MYAIIETGNKQYKVEKGDIIDVELLNIENDAKVEFKEVLLLSDGKEIKVGNPYVANTLVSGQVIGTVKDKKVLSFFYRKRKDSKKLTGHRQKHTRVKITEIKGA